MSFRNSTNFMSHFKGLVSFPVFWSYKLCFWITSTLSYKCGRKTNLQKKREMKVKWLMVGFLFFLGMVNVRLKPGRGHGSFPWVARYKSVVRADTPDHMSAFPSACSSNRGTENAFVSPSRLTIACEQASQEESVHVWLAVFLSQVDVDSQIWSITTTVPNSINWTEKDKVLSTESAYQIRLEL